MEWEETGICIFRLDTYRNTMLILFRVGPDPETYYWISIGIFSDTRKPDLDIRWVWDSRFFSPITV